MFSASRAHFADCLIERGGHAAECKHTVIFDQNAATGAGMRPAGLTCVLGQRKH